MIFALLKKKCCAVKKFIEYSGTHAIGYFGSRCVLASPSKSVHHEPFKKIYMFFFDYWTVFSTLIQFIHELAPRSLWLQIQAGKTFSYHGHALVTLYVQFLCSGWSKFDRWVHAENLCSILKVVLYFDSLRWSLQSFVSTCDVFNCIFPLDVQDEIQLLSRVFCYSWLVCLLGFWLRNASLVKIR